MSLIKCPDCQREHSDLAIACPRCGRPLTAATASSSIDSVTVIEVTGKRFKKMQAFGCLGMVLGPIFALAGATNMGLVLMVVSIGLYLVARYQAWWHHR